MILSRFHIIWQTLHRNV